MDTRATIESCLDQLYAARLANDVQASAACFAETGRFMPNGAPLATKSRAEQLAALGGLYEAFRAEKLVLHRIIDPPRAAVHWRGTFRAKNGMVGDADILDVIEFEGGRIASLTTFYDTAFAAALSA